MSREVIAVDVDDVLAEHVSAFVAFSNQNYGTQITPEDYTERWDELWDIYDMEEIERRALSFHTPENVLAFKHDQVAHEVLTELSSQKELVIVTARRRHMIDASLDWIDKHYNGIFSDVRFVPIWEPNNTVTKADICRQIGATVLIDDLPKHCNIAAQGGLRALLFGDYSWNRSEDIESGVTRVRDWPAVLEHLNA